MIIHLPSGRAVPGTLRGLGAEPPAPPGEAEAPQPGRLAKLYKKWWMLPLRIPLLPAEIPIRAARAAWRGAKTAAKATPGLVRKLPAAYKKTHEFVEQKLIPGFQTVEDVQHLVEKAYREKKRTEKQKAKREELKRARLPGFLSPTYVERARLYPSKLPGFLAPSTYEIPESAPMRRARKGRPPAPRSARRAPEPPPKTRTETRREPPPEKGSSPGKKGELTF